MPVPRPSKDETQSAFMGRCMKFMAEENNNKDAKSKRPQKQMVAICMSQWGHQGSSASRANEVQEISDEFIKKFLEKHPEYKEYFEEKTDDRQDQTN